MSNILTNGKDIIIINGGNPLEGCPTDWDEAKKWQEAANNGKEIDPEWSFDCGFKLDFDGPILGVSSRFYPPTTHGGPTWDGTCRIYIGDRIIADQKFDCKTLDQLRNEVEEYVDSFRKKISSLFD